jgi:hypothetical protein
MKPAEVGLCLHLHRNDEISAVGAARHKEAVKARVEKQRPGGGHDAKG